MSVESLNSIISSIAILLNYKDYCAWESCCRTYYQLSSNAMVWKTFFDRESDGLYSEFSNRKWTCTSPTKELFIKYFRMKQNTPLPLTDPAKPLEPVPGSLTELQKACEEGDFNRVQELDHSGNFGVNDYPHCMPPACQSRNREVVDYLAGKLLYPNIQFFNSKCFVVACTSLDSELAEIILEKHEPKNYTEEDMLAVLSTKCNSLILAFLDSCPTPQERGSAKAYPREFNICAFDEASANRLTSIYRSLKSSS